MRESTIQKKIMIALSMAGCVIWRNNTGVLKNEAGIPIKFGLCKGSSDLIGICPDGAFLAVEVKTATGKVSPDQRRFIAQVQTYGGRAGVARSVEDALAILEQKHLL